MAELLLAAVALTAAAIPHTLNLAEVAPGRAAAVWLAALWLRAWIVVASALILLAAVPNKLFQAASHRPLEALLRPLGVDLSLSGDPFVHALVLLPAVVLVASVIAYIAHLAHSSLALQRRLRLQALGDGPAGTRLIADPKIVVALPLVGGQRPIVSHGALAALDRHELQASIAHEFGHLRRGHRPLLLLAATLARLGRVLPGTKAAEQGLRLSLERDADEYAVRHTADPLALAAGICKAVQSRTATPGAIGLAHPDATTIRLEQLLAGGRQRRGPIYERAALVLALTLGIVTVASTAALATWVVPAPQLTQGVALALSCAS